MPRMTISLLPQPMCMNILPVMRFVCTLHGNDMSNRICSLLESLTLCRSWSTPISCVISSDFETKQKSSACLPTHLGSWTWWCRAGLAPAHGKLLHESRHESRYILHAITLTLIQLHYVLMYCWPCCIDALFFLDASDPASAPASWCPLGF